MDTKSQIQEFITNNPVAVFMKGTPEAPQCGFSAQVIQCLKAVGAPIAAVNVLADPNVRQGIKDFTQWPTIPQIFLKGEFIGGCDILTEMYEDGSLKEAVSAALK